MRAFLIALMVAVMAAVSAAPAFADRPAVTGTAEWAYARAYEAWNENWCGHGFTWSCHRKRSSHKETAHGDHSWVVGTCWVDVKGTKEFYVAWKQWCVYQAVTHGNLGALVKPSDPSVNNGRVLNASG